MNGSFFSRFEVNPISGGSINNTFKLKDENGSLFFCKNNSATLFPQLFEKEASGLQLIASYSVIKVPQVLQLHIDNDEQFLVLEWIESGNKTETFWKRFGEGLARLHRINNNYYGLETDNYMGSIPQQNTAQNTWTTFYWKQRLMPLIIQCRQQNLLAQKHEALFQKLARKLSSIFNEQEKPALVHGDLWSGNFMCSTTEEPYLIDPAIYFGHRSIDLGMTTLFGGFHPLFYEAYHYHYPFPANHKEQWNVCNLYPLLIHLLLFGKGYLPQIENTLRYFE